MATTSTGRFLPSVDVPRRWRYVLLFGYLALVYVAILAPIGYVFPFGLGGNFDAVTQQQYVDATLNSFKLALFVGVVTMTLGLIAARFYRRVEHKNTYLLALSLPLFIPGSTHALAIAVTARQFGIDNSFWTLAAAHVMYTFPFAFLIVLATMAGLPENLVAAAKDLGASDFRAFVDVELPLILDGAISAFLVGVLLSLNEAERASILGGNYTTLSGVLISYYEAVGLDPTLYTLNMLLVVFSLVIITVILFVLLVSPSRG